MKLSKKRSMQRKKTMKRKPPTRGGYDWRGDTPKKNRRNRGRGKRTRKTNK